MESETFYFLESIQALKTMGIDSSEFIATGGGAKSDAWLQIKADILGVPFVRPRNTECSVAGAAMLAGLATGVYKNPAEAVECFVQKDKVFEPNLDRQKIYKDRYELYRQLYPRLSDLLPKL
jgi:xylulokinase